MRFFGIIGANIGSIGSNTSNTSWLETLTSQCGNGSTGMLCFAVRAGRNSCAMRRRTPPAQAAKRQRGEAVDEGRCVDGREWTMGEW